MCRKWLGTQPSRRSKAAKNGYAVTQGMPVAPGATAIAGRCRIWPRRIASSSSTSGTSGGLMLAMMALIDPGDEVIMFDPYFVMRYEPLGKADWRRARSD